MKNWLTFSLEHSRKSTDYLQRFSGTQEEVLEEAVEELRDYFINCGGMVIERMDDIITLYHFLSDKHLKESLVDNVLYYLELEME